MLLKLISSNIRYENTHDGIHSWENRRPLIQKIVTLFTPDILATQEGLEKQIKSLAKNLSLKLIESHRQWIDERMYPCLYANEKKIKIIKSGDIWLSQTPYIPGSCSFKSSFPRLCTWMQVTHLISNKDYFIVNTHLDHILEETRIEQTKVLIREIKMLNEQQLPLILMGDFNDSPTSNIRKIILNSFDLKDPWVEIGLPEETTHHGFKKKDGDRIDWILIPKTFSIKEIYLEKKCFDGIFPSDHYPLFATVIPS